MSLILSTAICAPLAFASSSTPHATTISTPLLPLLPGSMPVYGARLTFFSVVSAASPGGGSIPAGTVTFTLDGVQTSTPQPVNPSGAASISLLFTAGTHSISAHYDGSSNYLASSSGTLSLTVEKASSALTMASNPPQLNQAVAIRAAPTLVNPATTIAAGTVDFTNGGVSIAGCASVPVGSGVAVCNTKFPQLGTFTITATYSGDVNVKPSTANIQLTVAKVVASVYTASAPAMPVFGVPVIVNALLLGADGDPTPTGTVTFLDAGATLASLPVGPDGRASLVMPSESLARLNTGPHTIMAKYNGDANYQSSTAPPLTIVVGKAPTSLSLGSTPPQVGQLTTLKALVLVGPPGSGPVEGLLDFNIAGKVIAGCTGLPTQNGIATCKTSFPQLGDNTFGASYSGDANTAPSTATVPVTVGKATVGIYTAATPSLPVFGAPVTVNALVLGAAGLADPRGTVTFSDGADVQATIPLGGDGRASFVPASNGRGPLAVGLHSLVAVYNGDANYSSSTASALKLPIDKAGTSTVLTGAAGAPFTAAVTVLAPGAGAPSGTVQFFQAGALIGTAPLVQGGSSFGATLPAPSQSGSIWAIYQGDANFSASTSQPVAPTTPRANVSIANASGLAIAGQPVSFTVQVSASSGMGIPSGSVQLLSDGVSLGTAPLASGQATLAAALTVGLHSLTAAYSGDSIYPAASATIQQLVSKSVISLSLTSSASTTVYGQPVTFTAQTSGAVSSGTVQFLDGPAVIASAQSTDGVARLVTANLSVGTHSITSAYPGVDNSPSVLQTVNKASTSTALVLSGLTLNAAVTTIGPGAGTPTGTVTFVHAASGNAFDAGVLVGGSVTAPLTSIANSIRAAYSGDANFEPSISSTLIPLAAVNAASYTAATFAPDEIVTLFALDLAKPTIQVTDSTGVRHPVEMLFGSPTQISFVLPTDTASGPATIIVTGTNRIPVATTIMVGAAAPGIFTLSGNGQGPPAAQLSRVHSDGTRDAPQDAGVFDPGQNRWLPVPIDLGATTDTVYLALYGTGLRHSSGTPVCLIAGQQLPIAFVGAQSGFAGLDQVNLALPPSLRGMGTVEATLLADGTASNSVTLIFP